MKPTKIMISKADKDLCYWQNTLENLIFLTENFNLRHTQTTADEIRYEIH